MSRSKVGATSEGMVPAPRKGAAEAAGSTSDIVSMIKTIMDDKFDQLISRMDRLEMKVDNLSGNEVIEEDMPGELSKPAAADGVIRNSPQDGTHPLPPRSDEEQRSTGLHEEEQGQAPAPRPGRSTEKGSNPGGGGQQTKQGESCRPMEYALYWSY